MLFSNVCQQLYNPNPMAAGSFIAAIYFFEQKLKGLGILLRMGHTSTKEISSNAIMPEKRWLQVPKKKGVFFTSVLCYLPISSLLNSFKISPAPFMVLIYFTETCPEPVEGYRRIALRIVLSICRRPVRAKSKDIEVLVLSSVQSFVQQKKYG